MRVAVATYRRPQSVQTSTLAFLRRSGLSEITDLWVADEEEERAYREAVPRGMYDRLIVGEPGLVRARNRMMRFYPKGTRVLHCNDDVDGILRLSPEGKGTREDASFGEWVRRAFDLAERERLGMWGLYPTPNPGWMKPRARVGWQLTVGSLFGQIVTGSAGETLPPGCDDKEDHWRSAIYLDNEGALLRLENVAVRTDYYRKPGGMTEVRTVESSAGVAEGLLSRWPHLFTPGKPKKQYGFPEVRFRRMPSTNLPPLDWPE